MDKVVENGYVRSGYGCRTVTKNDCGGASEKSESDSYKQRYCSIMQLK